MVSKHIRTSEPPPLDEEWWAALLTEEGKYSQVPPANTADKVDEPEQETHLPTRPPAKAEGVDWERVQALFDQDEPVNLQVSGFNRGGLLVGGDSLQGFVPISHLVDSNCQMEDKERDAFLEGYIGTTISLKVIECDPERGRIVFSERAALSAGGRRNQLFENLSPGDQVCGMVTNITEFGVFVDLGGVEGLIHVSELSWGRVRHPADVAKVGDQLLVYVIQVDKSRSRIALSLKRLRPNPWLTADEHYRPGEVVEAVITSIVPFGAFARLEEGLDGLIHVTELNSSRDDSNPIERVREGQTVRVRILNVDAVKQRLGLSLNLEDG